MVYHSGSSSSSAYTPHLCICIQMNKRIRKKILYYLTCVDSIQQVFLLVFLHFAVVVRSFRQPACLPRRSRHLYCTTQMKHNDVCASVVLLPVSTNFSLTQSQCFHVSQRYVMFGGCVCACCSIGFEEVSDENAVAE